MDRDYWLRVASLDKRFVIPCPIGRQLDEPPTILVIGSEFPGLATSDARPVRLVVTEPLGFPSMGAWVEHLLRWSLDPAHRIVRHTGPVRFA